MIEEDILWTFEQTGILKIADGKAYLCTNSDFLSEIYKKGGREGKRVVR
jgi:hypothetical protein